MIDKEIPEDRYLAFVIYDLFGLGYSVGYIATLFHVPRKYVIDITGTDE